MPPDPSRKTPLAIPWARPAEKYRERRLSPPPCHRPPLQRQSFLHFPPRSPLSHDKNMCSPTPRSDQGMIGLSPLGIPPHIAQRRPERFSSRSSCPLPAG